MAGPSETSTGTAADLGCAQTATELGQTVWARRFARCGTISRWLKRWGLVAGGRRRRRGPVILRRAVREARHCNDVWTVDFKGWYHCSDCLWELVSGIRLGRILKIKRCPCEQCE